MKLRPFSLPALLLVASSAAAADASTISGTYTDPVGNTFEVHHDGAAISLTQKSLTSSLPEEAVKALGEVVLRGSYQGKSDGFSISATYSKEVTPNPALKVKLRIDLESTGKPSEHGLVMTSCDYRATVILFSKGEIAGSENRTEKCVGLWKKK